MSSFKTRDPFKIARLLQIEVIEYYFPDDIKGYFVKDTKFDEPIIALNTSLQSPFQTVVLSHELGHAFLHPDISRYYIERHTLFIPDKIEREANQFTAELLIPDEQLYKYLHSGETLSWIAFEFDVPEELVRMKTENFKE